MFGFPFTAMPIVCLVFILTEFSISFTFYSFIVGNTNVHTNKWTSLFCLFICILSLCLFPHSLYLIVTSNKYLKWIWMLVSTICLTSPLVFVLRLSLCGHFKYYFDFKFLCKMVWACVCVFVTIKLSVVRFVWIEKKKESSPTVLIKKLLQWKSKQLLAQNIYYFRFQILLYKP